VYATDSGLKPDFSPSGTDTVYKISGGVATALAKAPQVKGPNGVAVRSNGKIVVVSFNPTGEIYTLGAGGQVEAVRNAPKGQLDGVVVLANGALLISSWAASAVYEITAAGRASVAVPNVKAPADIGYDGRRRRVLIPLFQDNIVVIQALR
jgi:sugar lactone lactonase YvrE